MAVDPTIHLAARDLEGTFWAYEVADPVEDDQYGYEIGGVLVTDFVTPAWFGFQNSSSPLDFKRHAEQAFTVLSGGYAQKFGPNGWEQVNGPETLKADAASRAREPPTGSWRDRRLRQSKSAGAGLQLTADFEARGREARGLSGAALAVGSRRRWPMSCQRRCAITATRRERAVLDDQWWPPWPPPRAPA